MGEPSALLLALDALRAMEVAADAGDWDRVAALDEGFQGLLQPLATGDVAAAPSDAPLLLALRDRVDGLAHRAQQRQDELQRERKVEIKNSEALNRAYGA